MDGGNSGLVLGGLTASQVLNFGTITGTASYGVDLGAGGVLVNGTKGDTSALIQGMHPVYAGGINVATIANYGTIAAVAGGATAVVLVSGGTVTNGSTADTAALINGPTGVSILNGSGVIVNFGTIEGAISFYGTRPANGATLTGTGTVINAGTIISGAGPGGTAIHFGSGTGAPDR